MDSNALKKATISGLIYRFGERFLAQLITTIVSIILARILLPEDYGVISIVTVLITLLNVFVTNGLGTALVRKESYCQEDYSTVFWSGLVMSAVLYAGIFFAAPAVAAYYENALIGDVLRVMALRLPLAAVNSVQHAYISQKLMFKKFFCVTLLGTALSGVLGIGAAYLGWGVWALVLQYMSGSILSAIFLFLMVGWRPTVYFSFLRFKSLFSFGWKIMATGLISTLYEEVRSLIIGKKYGTVDLSFYTKGKQLPQLVGNNISTTLTNVMFPVFSKIQDDKAKLKAGVRRAIRMSCLLLFPMMVGFYAVSDNFVKAILTEKWMPSAPFVRIFCVVFIFKPIKNINKSALKALGRAEINLYVEVAEKLIGVLLILITMNLGVDYLAYSVLLTYIFGALTDAFINGKLLQYSMLEQLKDILPELCVSVLMGIVVWAVGFVPIESALLVLVLQVTIGVAFYIAACALLKLESYSYLLQTVKKYIPKREKTSEK